MPAATTLHYVFKRLDVPAFEAALNAWAARALAPDEEQLVLHGKALRGSHGEEWPGVCLVAVSAAAAGLGDRRQRGVRTREEQAPTEEEREQAKQEAELSVAPRLLRQVAKAGALRGRLVSGDALSGQKALCRQIRRAGGDSLLAVKGNQPTLLEHVSVLFRDPLRVSAS